MLSGRTQPGSAQCSMCRLQTEHVANTTITKIIIRKQYLLQFGVYSFDNWCQFVPIYHWVKKMFNKKISTGQSCLKF